MFVKIDWKAALLLGIAVLLAIGLVFYPDAMSNAIDGAMNAAPNVELSIEGVPP